MARPNALRPITPLPTLRAFLRRLPRRVAECRRLRLPTLLALFVWLSLSALPAAALPPQSAGPTSAEASIREAVARFQDALNGVFRGDAGRMADVWSRRPGVTNMDSYGGRQQGWTEVADRFQREAAAKLGGRTRIGNLVVGRAGPTAWVSGLEIVERDALDGSLLREELRFTAILGRENGRWRFVHRHADPASNALPASGMDAAALRLFEVVRD